MLKSQIQKPKRMKGKPVVLIVDDQPQNIELYEAYLALEAYEIVKATNGEEALEKLSKNQIDLILLDVRMPGMDGYEVTRRVRLDHTHRRLPIILVTILRETEDRLKGIEAGCDDFISSPVDKMELLARVRSLLKVKAYNDLMSHYRKELESEVTLRTEELKQALERLQQDTTKRKLAEAELLETKTLVDAVVENVPLMVFIKEATDLRFVIFNRAGEELLGHDRKELLGKNNLDLFPPEQAANFMAKDREALAGQSMVDIPEEPILTAKKGQRLLHTRKICILGADGTTKYLLGISEDITERKRAEEATQASLREKEILLREIHHRVKNNMQIISSLFSLQSGHIKDESARRMLKEGQLRIRSMALVHEKLYQSRDLSKIDFADYLRSLSAHLFQFFQVDAGRIRIETDMEAVHLDINSAVPCGLLVTELITNALKHAFPGNRKGMVGIKLHRREDGTMDLGVADDGVGFPGAVDFRQAESLGLQIVALLVGQLEGTIELDRKKGTAFTIAFRELGYKARI